MDIVYSRFGYQKFIPSLLSKADRIFTISNHTKIECIARGIPERKLNVIPIGINLDEIKSCTDEEKLRTLARYRINKDGKVVLLTTGRLVKRKGHEWFLKEVMQYLPLQYIYLIAGIGPESEEIARTIEDLGMKERVHMLGYVTDEDKNCLYQISDVFVMPNIKIANDQEGFGIVNIEAGSYGLPVVATKIEGIIDAVIDGKTGRLIQENDSQGFITAILDPNLDQEAIKTAVVSHFHVKKMVKRYAEEFERLIESSH